MKISSWVLNIETDEGPDVVISNFGSLHQVTVSGPNGMYHVPKAESEKYGIPEEVPTKIALRGIIRQALASYDAAVLKMATAGGGPEPKPESEKKNGRTLRGKRSGRSGRK